MNGVYRFIKINGNGENICVRGEVENILFSIWKVRLILIIKLRELWCGLLDIINDYFD